MHIPQLQVTRQVLQQMEAQGRLSMDLQPLIDDITKIEAKMLHEALSLLDSEVVVVMKEVGMNLVVQQDDYLHITDTGFKIQGIEYEVGNILDIDVPNQIIII